MNIENLKKFTYWEYFKEGKMRKSRKIQERNWSKAESRGRRKTKRQEEWEEFAHYMMMKT